MGAFVSDAGTPHGSSAATIRSAFTSSAPLRALIVDSFGEAEARFRIIYLSNFVAILVQLAGYLEEHVVDARVVLGARLIEKLYSVLGRKRLQFL